MKTIKITAHNKISIIDVDFGDYKAMQKAVGGYVETVATEQMYDFFKRPVIMLVDKEGRMKELELNIIGTVLTVWYLLWAILFWHSRPACTEKTWKVLVSRRRQ